MAAPTRESTRQKYHTSTNEEAGYTRLKHVYIRMRDGIELCADVFLPFSASKEGQRVPVLCSLGPYGKDIHAASFGLPKTPIYASMYKEIKPLGPDACFELVEPMIWTKDWGYAVVRVDERGIGGSQGNLDPFGLQRSIEIQADAEGQDLYDIVEWAGTQPWSSGKVAMAGISYYGMVGYWTAMQKPPHLACVLTYESACDMYHAGRRGGVYSENFQGHWYNNIVLPYQSGAQDKSLSEQQLAANRTDFLAILRTTEYPTQGVWEVLAKSRKLSDIEVPIYMAGNWTDPELHLPGNILAFNNISSKDKWLEMHTGNHVSTFYWPDHLELQKKFLDHYLLDKKDNGMTDVPRLRLLQRCGRQNFYREAETGFPPSDAEEVSWYLSPSKGLTRETPEGDEEAFVYNGLEGRLQLVTEEPFAETFEILGSPYLELEVSTEAKDMDLFIYLRALSADNGPIVLEGNHSEPMDSFARGYFRLSHREEVEQGFRSQNKIPSPARLPASTVEAGRIYKVTVPVYPTAYMFQPGEKLQLEIGAQNSASTIPPMRHDGGDRTVERFSGLNKVLSHGKLVIPRVKR